MFKSSPIENSLGLDGRLLEVLHHEDILHLLLCWGEHGEVEHEADTCKTRSAWKSEIWLIFTWMHEMPLPPESLLGLFLLLGKVGATV